MEIMTLRRAVTGDVVCQFSSKLDTGSLEGLLRSVEKEIILEAITDSGGNMKEAAEALGISPSWLYQKRLKYGLA